MFPSSLFPPRLFAPALFPRRGGAPPPAQPNLKVAIVSALEASAPLAAVVSNRIFPVVIPQTATFPALCYRVVSSVHDSHLRGAAGMKWVRVAFEVRSTRHSEAEAVREILRNLWQGLIGEVDGLKVAFVILDTEVDEYEEPIGGSDLGTHWKRIDFRFKIRESIPTFS